MVGVVPDIEDSGGVVTGMEGEVGNLQLWPCARLLGLKASTPVGTACGWLRGVRSWLGGVRSIGAECLWGGAAGRGFV